MQTSSNYEGSSGRVNQYLNLTNVEDWDQILTKESESTPDHFICFDNEQKKFEIFSKKNKPRNATKLSIEDILKISESFTTKLGQSKDNNASFKKYIHLSLTSKFLKLAKKNASDSFLSKIANYFRGHGFISTKEYIEKKSLQFEPNFGELNIGELKVSEFLQLNDKIKEFVLDRIFNSNSYTEVTLNQSVLNSEAHDKISSKPSEDLTFTELETLPSEKLQELKQSFSGIQSVVDKILNIRKEKIENIEE